MFKYNSNAQSLVKIMYAVNYNQIETIEFYLKYFHKADVNT